MNNITFEQLPQAVSMLIEKVGLLTDKVEKVLGMTPQRMASVAPCSPLMKSRHFSANRHPPSMP